MKFWVNFCLTIFLLGWAPAPSHVSAREKQWEDGELDYIYSFPLLSFQSVCWLKHRGVLMMTVSGDFVLLLTICAGTKPSIMILNSTFFFSVQRGTEDCGQSCLEFRHGRRGDDKQRSINIYGWRRVRGKGSVRWKAIRGRLYMKGRAGSGQKRWTNTDKGKYVNIYEQLPQ